MSRKPKRWWPGMFEGRTPSNPPPFGSCVPGVPQEPFTPRSMRGVNLHTAAIRKDGHIMAPLSGRTS